MMQLYIEQLPDIQNWASLVKNVLAHTGFYHVWLSARGWTMSNHFISITNNVYKITLSKIGTQE